MAPNGVSTGLDIGLSLVSLHFITLSFYTMCKATSPLFLLFFAILWGLERLNMSLLAIVGTITPGLALLVRPIDPPSLVVTQTTRPHENTACGAC